jgi:hypothetical protein
MDKTIDMAREAGFEQVDQDVDEWICFTDEIERFEALVRADERSVEREAMLHLALLHGAPWHFQEAIRNRGNT